MGDINALHTAFPLDADKEYLTQADVILSTLKLDKLRERELARVQERSSRSCDEKVNLICRVFAKFVPIQW